jgi:LCP family protein required for cell wall assembly
MDIVRKKKLPQEKPKNFDSFTPKKSVRFQYPSDDDNHFVPQKSEPIKKEKRKKGSVLKKIFFTLFFLALLISIPVYFSWKINSIGQKITLSSNDSGKSSNESPLLPLSSLLSSQEKITLEGENDGRINILMLGIAGENKPGKNLTDTIIIMSINTTTKKIGLLSLPRDLYTNIPKTTKYTKINSVYQYGLDNDQGITPIKETVENITGLNIPYFLVVDFEGFEKIIDNLGGINVNVERDIYDARYPGPNYSYETFEIKKGLQKIDGATALKYARERHNDPEGDFGRAKRQQQVIQAVKNKAFSLKTFFNFITINNLLDTLGNHVKTNIQLDEIKSFIELSRQVDTQNISTTVVDAWKKDSLLKVSHVFYGDTRAFILVPRAGNYSEIQELSSNIFNLDFATKKNKAIIKEEAKIAIINASNETALAQKIVGLLQDKIKLGTVSIIKNPTKEKISTTSVFDATRRSKPFTLNEIAKKLPATISDSKNAILNNIELEDYDFIITLGDDLIPLYSFEEDSIEDIQDSNIDQMYLDLFEQK